MIVSQEWIAEFLKGDTFAPSHGAKFDGYLGTGMLYYAITYMLRADLAVCLGSGSGFVPKLMRTAQRDLMLESRTVLIDGNIQDCKWGRPIYFNQPSVFTENYPDVEIWEMTTTEAVKKFKDDSICYLHIDADHSYEGVYRDFALYRSKMKDGSIVTLHDTNAFSTHRGAGVNQLVEEMQEHGLNVVNLPFLGHGIAICGII